MGKAIEGAVMLAGAVGMGALAFFQPELLAVPGFVQGMGALALGGLSMEAGAIASALTSNRGMNITTRQPASLRQVIYGCQRVGGVQIFRSTTGSKHDQFNFAICVAGHQCWGIESLYLDGRKVYWEDGSGTRNYNGLIFGGAANSNVFTGPNGQQYNFGGKVYCEMRDGTQSPGDVIGGFTANEPAWSATSAGSPYVGGCTYVYLKVEYDTDLFPAEPEIRFTVFGKPIYDPRSGNTGYSSNPALIINDILTDPEYGLGDNSVNQEQLIAAANLCDEQVSCAAGTEARYSAHWHYDTSTAPGDAISVFLGAMAGKLSRVGGEWYIWPGAFYGASAAFGADSLTAPVQWSETRSFHELFNRVYGTYTAPNFPYSVTGDLYDSNGWYNGGIQNNFPFAFQQTSYPPYACDVLHGYAADEYLNEDTGSVGTWDASGGTAYHTGDVVRFDGLFYQALVDNQSQMFPTLNTVDWTITPGTLLPKELGQPAVLSVSQAQRLASIALKANRQQGSGTLQMSLAAFQLQPVDTFLMTFPQQGWADKLLEVNSTHFEVATDSNGQPLVQVTLGVNETAASVWEWSTTEELTVYDVPAVSAQAPATPAAPTNMVLTSSAATALVQPDGSVLPRIEVAWDTPLDIRVTQVQMQYQLTAATAWTDAGLVDVSLNSGYINGVVAGQQYDVRIRSVRASGGTSAWVEIDGFVAGLVLNIQSQDGFGIGSLIPEAYTNGTAAIICEPFTASVGSLSLSIFPSGAVTLTGLLQQTLYYVYWIDPTYAGGDVTPIATTNRADYLGKLGYFLIDNVITGYCGATGTGARYSPSNFIDMGTRGTQNAGQAYDGDLTTLASVGGSTTSTYTPGFGGEPPETDTYEANGDTVWNQFPGIVTTTPLNLYVSATASSRVIGSASAGTFTISATVAGVTTALSATGNLYSLAIPTGTNLGTVSVEVAATGGGADASATHPASSVMTVQVAEIYIQT